MPQNTLRPNMTRALVVTLAGIALLGATVLAFAAPPREKKKSEKEKATEKAPVDAKKTRTNTPAPPTSGEYTAFGIYEKTAPRPKPAQPLITKLPLALQKGDRIALIGNTLFEREREFGHLEALLQRRFAELELVVRNLAWSADMIDLAPRPDNFADTEQHLTHEKATVVLAAFGFNESFAGADGLPEFRKRLAEYVRELKSKSFAGISAARIVLVSPIANENVRGVAAADLNNARLTLYVNAMREVAAEQQVGFADVFAPTLDAMRAADSDLTTNGVHLNGEGNHVFAGALFRTLTGAEPPAVNHILLAAVVDKNQQFFHRFRPLNTFYYTGGRSREYGYLDFLPAMQNFDIMVANRDRRLWDLAAGKAVPLKIDDSNVPPLPAVAQGRGANEWLSATEELKAFKVDPRFEVNLFAGEEQFPEIANPIQMRWDARGRLWVSCSTTYPHVYPGNAPRDKLVILEDTDGDGRADKSKVFVDDLHIPLSFEFGNGGVYVSEQPQLTFLKDTNGDDRADVREVVLSGFGTEDSHHSLHDFTWTPDGDLLFRESIFHHSQVETPYGPVRMQNSGWFRYNVHTRRLIAFGSYPSTNPWGVTFDDWGNHVASHPVYAAAFHALNPPYPQQQLPPAGMQAYSGVCGHEFVDFATFPPELRGTSFIKVRYKPTNRVEILEWKETPFGYEEKYTGDLLFSTNLSFIPVDLQYGPNGAMYVCDWYNPIKGHAQYSLRDERRRRDSGRIWRITAKGIPLVDPPRIAGASITELLELLKRPEYRVRYWAKRELRERNAAEVRAALAAWVAKLDATDPRYRHHQLEALWTYRYTGLAPLVAPSTAAVKPSADLQPALALLRELLTCNEHHARAAATQQLRYWYVYADDAAALLRKAASDASALVRMEAAIAATYMGTQEAFEALLEVLKHPRSGAVAYAVHCSFSAETMRQYWEGNSKYDIAKLLKQAGRASVIAEPKPTAAEAQFDRTPKLKQVKISCIAEKMLFDVTNFSVQPGQAVKLVFTNPDATDHNLVIVKPGALEEVGMAANEMAKDPRNAVSDFVPPQKKSVILHATPMIGPTRDSQVTVLRFTAPTERGVYPFVCTFPGHWVVMNGQMVVAKNQADADALLAESLPKIVKEWSLADFAEFDKHVRGAEEGAIVRGMSAFVKARCNQCHIVAGHAVNLGPNLEESVKKLKGRELLEEIVTPSSKIHDKFQNYQFVTSTGRTVTGVIVQEDKTAYQVATNLLTPNSLTTIPKDDVEAKVASKISPMPTGLLNVLTQDEIFDLLAFVEAAPDKLPAHLKHQH